MDIHVLIEGGLFVLPMLTVLYLFFEKRIWNTVQDIAVGVFYMVIGNIDE